MTAVSYVNEIYGDEAAKRRARVKARFVNGAMMATLLGAIVSDGLENGQVVSGVGGPIQFHRAGLRPAGCPLHHHDAGDPQRQAHARAPTSAGNTATRPSRGICATSW